MSISSITFNTLKARQDEEVRLAMQQHQSRMRAMAERHRQELLELSLESQEPGHLAVLLLKIREIACSNAGGANGAGAAVLLQLLEQVETEALRKKKSEN